MSVLRPALALAACAAVAVSGVASAAPKAKPKPKPVCNLIVDDKGDGEGFVDSSGGLDVLSADLASDARNVTAVLRLAAAPPAPADPNAPEGASYYVVWNAPDAKNPVYLVASSDATGAFSYAMGDVQPSPTGGSLYQNATGAATGSVKGSTITISVDRGVLSSLASMKPGTKIGGLQAAVFYPVEVPMVGGLLEEADSAASNKTYTTGAPSCVAPGKV